MSYDRATDVESSVGHRAADALLVDAARRGGAGLVVLAVAALIAAVAQTALPAVLGRAFDSVVGDASRTWVAWCGAVIAVMVVCDLVDDLAAGAVTARSTAWVRHRLNRHVLAVGPQGGARFPPGEVATRMVGNAADAGGVAPFIVSTAADLLPPVGATVALALIDPWLCVTFLAGLPVLVVLLRTFARDATEIAARYLEVQGRIAARFAEALSGVRTIAAAGTATREGERVLADLPRLRAFGHGMWRAQARIAAQDALVVPLVEVLVLAVAGVQLARGDLTPGELLAAAQYVALGAGFGSAVTAATQLARARAGAGRVAEVLALAPVPYGDAVLPAAHSGLEFRGVTVLSGGRRVLDGIDLVIPSGAFVAVVGRSRSGKSVLAALAGRLADPDEGEVLLDGVPLRQLGRGPLRDEVAYGFERPVLIGATVADAVAFGSRRPPLVELIDAAVAAEADGFIWRLPQGYLTPLPLAPMSGGELQRVGLARVFAAGGRLVVLDDVAASLDTVTEHRIGEVLSGAMAGRTRLVVAQRVSTAARTDLVAWLDEGRVRALAPHRVLWRDAEYRAIFAAQPAPSSAVERDPEPAPQPPSQPGPQPAPWPTATGRGQR